MANPYKNRPPYTFWRRAVSDAESHTFDPVTSVKFTISKTDHVAAAGSCFAQHISKTLIKTGFTYLVTEQAPSADSEDASSYGVFPARFSNIYTARQLLQLFTRAYGQFEPASTYWRLSNGSFVDPFRPRITEKGFSSLEELENDQKRHLAAVREMFESCDVFIFTLGLTEGWEMTADGAVVPIPPGVLGVNEADCRPHNFSAEEVVNDLRRFVEKFRSVNPSVRILLTVSPVPLAATYEERHVLTSTTYSKSVLRVAAETITTSDKTIEYFPSYEIITGPQARGRYYAEDLREVTPEGVSHVMKVFSAHYLTESTTAAKSSSAPSKISASEAAAIRMLEDTICDEDFIGESATKAGN